jgi:diguanylate cyclase (GGDEF)-like protein/PAS domain S-box-containing protein
VADPDGTIVRVNPAMEAITGYQSEELVGQHAGVLKSDRHEQRFYEELWSTLVAEGAWVGEVWTVRKGGEPFPQLLSVRAVRDQDDDVESLVAVCHDISERKEAEDRLHYLATHDSLTGLPNRAYLNNLLDHTLRQARRAEELTAVLFLDIDNFKDVNDSHGHDAGDQLLKWIARRLEFQLREEDIVVRFGGDEFVIVLPRIEDAEFASVVARRILAAVRDPYLVGSQKMRPSVSIGVAVYPEAGREAADLLRDADAAMYAAKRQGRNTYRFHNPGMNENAHRRLAMQGSVASAIDNDEFRVLYQPILALADGRIAGAEALVRWEREGRLVMPGEFLPYLENSSMLSRLDLWVLDQVCLEMKEVQDAHGADFLVSVNAGAYNLIQDDFVPRVTETVSRNGVDPSRIAIEVTETAAIRNFDRARATLRELQSAGFKLYLDDFGEGYSSIRYLREFGVDSVKLDRTYLTNVEHSEPARSLVSGFTQLAHGMRLHAVVEGVETEGQLDFVREAGCDYAQGFLVGKPAPLTQSLQPFRMSAS